MENQNTPAAVLAAEARRLASDLQARSRDASKRKTADDLHAAIDRLREMAEGAQGEAVASIYVSAGGAREFDDWRHPLPTGRTLLYIAPVEAALHPRTS